MAIEPRLVRPRVLVGARRARHHHAARPLAGDEGDRPGAGRAGRARRAAARRGRARRRRRSGRRRCRSASSQPATLVLVRPGARVPADGIVVEGEAELDESMITGESTPGRQGRPATGSSRERSSTDSVDPRAGRRGRRRHRARRHPATRRRGPVQPQPGPGARRPVRRARSSTSRPEPRSSRSSSGRSLGETDEAVESTVTVLVIACPHALGLAIPLVIALSTAIAARNGILVKDRLALERMRTVDAVLFDKTGTLTKGRHTSSPASPGSARPEAEVLRLAAGVEADSEHPLARAIVAEAERSGDGPAPASDFRSLTGRGVEAIVDGAALRRRWSGAAARARARRSRPDLQQHVDAWSAARRVRAVPRCMTTESIGALALEDEVRPEAADAVRELHELGVERVVMITGDARSGRRRGRPRTSGSTRSSPRSCPRTRTRRSPSSSSAASRWPWSATASTTRRRSPAPTSASRSAPAPTSPSNRPASCSRRPIRAVSPPSSACPGRRYRKMIQNLAWAAGYNIVAIPLAAGVLAWAGITLAAGRRRRADEPLDDRRGAQRPAPAPGPAHPAALITAPRAARDG